MAQGLYTSADLLRGYNRKRPETFVQTWDFQQFIAFTKGGGPAPRKLRQAIRQARHDAEISHALGRYLRKQKKALGFTPKLVAVMGGHGLDRNTPAYRLVADIARDLTNHGYLIVTGGGPGAMEAGHVGAYFAKASNALYEAAIKTLSDKAVAHLPGSLGQILDKKGGLAPNQQTAYADAARWLNAALDARDSFKGPVGESLAIPTWLYGSEPTTPFATAYAKYFENSLREETLVAEGKTGTLYAQGGGGTVREIFQGVEHDYYVSDARAFSPMIFVDPDRFWERDATYTTKAVVRSPGIKMDSVVPAVLKYGLSGMKEPDRSACAAKVRFSVDLDEIRSLLDGHAPAAQLRLGLLLTGAPANLLGAR
jgi:hypothetical protein